MSYVREPQVTNFDGEAVFEKIERQENIEIAGDARNPLDDASLVIPGGTVVTAVHTGVAHNDGQVMPLRRVDITAAQAQASATCVVSDASAFKIGDVVQIGSVDGTDLDDGGALVNVVQATNTLTMTNLVIQAIGDVVEVTENGQMISDGAAGWVRKPIQTIGITPVPVDLRVGVDDTDGTTARARMVTAGTIRADKLNWPMEVDDLLLEGCLASAGGNLRILTRPTV